LNRLFIVTDERGERQLQAQALPLQLGGEQVGDIVMPGIPAGQLLGHIALSDGHAFLQSADDSLPLYHNHERLSGSCWLKSGDEVRFQNAVMDWRVQGDMTFVTTQTQVLDSPPQTPAAAVTLQPPRRTLPEVSVSATAGRKRSIWRWLLFFAFMLLLLAAVFVLFATPLAIKVSPHPEQQSISGFPPPLTLGDRLLALPGQYVLSASLTGYRPLHSDITVKRGELQTFELLLEELPGRVMIELQPPVAFRVLVADTGV